MLRTLFNLTSATLPVCPFCPDLLVLPMTSTSEIDTLFPEYGIISLDHSQAHRMFILEENIWFNPPFYRKEDEVHELPRCLHREGNL